MRSNTKYLVCFYVALVALFFAVNLGAPRSPETIPWPVFSRSDAASASIWDTGLLTRSVAKLPSVRVLRRTGNSMRLALGQSLDWVIWGAGRPPVLAPRIELPLSHGLGDESIKANLDHLILRLGQYSRKLRADGWQLVVVPVPTKLSIYREAFSWPLLDEDPLTRRPVPADGADALMRYLFAELHSRDVAAVDLQTLYRAERFAHPDAWLYPPGESHWTGHGLRIAAQASAEKIHAIAGVPLQMPTAAPRPVDHYGDLAVSFDPLPSWLGRLDGSYHFRDELSTWPVYDPRPGDSPPASLVVVLGTSYTGQYGWLVNEPVGYAPAIGAFLGHATIRQISQTGIGGYHPFKTFLERRSALLGEFCRAAGERPESARKIVVWEFPMRDFGYLTAHNEATVARIENPNGLERHLGRDLFWIGDKPATVWVIASEDGVVDFHAALHPGPAIAGGGPRGTLLISNERQAVFAARVPGGPQTIRVPISAGLNCLKWSAADPLLPPKAEAAIRACSR